MQAVIQKLDSQGRIASTMQRLPEGIAGTQQTLALMHESIVGALLSDAVIAAALVAADLTNRASSAREEVRRVQLWVQRHIAYVLDPLKIELLQSPAVTLQRRRGDCDDQTVLLCALLSVLGYKARMVAVGFAPSTYAHVYCEVNVDGQWLAAETIKPWALGQEPNGVAATMRMVVNIPAERAAELSGLFSKIKSAVKSVTKPVVSVVKGAVTSVVKDPVGTIAAVGMAAAGNPTALLSQAAGGVAANQAAKDAKQLAEYQAQQMALAQSQATAQPLAPVPATAAVPGSFSSWVAANKVPLAIGGATLTLTALMLIAARGRK